MTSSSEGEQTPTEISSAPSSESARDTPRDFDDQTVHSSWGERPSHVQGRQPHQRPLVFTKTTAPSGRMVIGDRHARVKIEDVEESLDSGTLSDDEGSSEDVNTGIPPHHGHLKTKSAKVSKFKEPASAEIPQSKSRPRPNAFVVENVEIEGRVPTPELRKSLPGQQGRHHLDTTTPSGGGILISPTKPDVGVVKSVELPHSSVSPKCRRDMRTIPPEVGKGRQDKAAPSAAIHKPRSVTGSLGPQSVRPPSDSLYQLHPPTLPHSRPTHSVTHAPPSHPPYSHHHTHKSRPHHQSSLQQAHKATGVQPKGPSGKLQSEFSGPVRKLLFESHSKQPASQLLTQHVPKKTLSSSAKYKTQTAKMSNLSAAKSSHSNVKSCETCGSHLRSPAVLGGGVCALGAGASRRVAPPTNLSQMHSDRATAMQASRQQSQIKLNEIRSKLASHEIINPHKEAPGDYQQADSGLGSSNRGRGGGQQSSGPVGNGKRARDVEELSLSSLSLSSCSVASDVLQKARERRDRFWTQPTHITAS